MHFSKKSQKRAKNYQKKPKPPHRQYGTHFEEDFIPIKNLAFFPHYDLPRKLIQTTIVMEHYIDNCIFYLTELKISMFNGKNAYKDMNYIYHIIAKQVGL